MSETKKELPEIMLALSRAGIIPFRNNTGMGWVGAGKPVRLANGDMLLKNPVRPLHAGLTRGSSDIIGLTEVTITPDMVGQKIAVFTAIEVKTKTGKASEEQLNFIKIVTEMGGFSGVAKTPEDALKICKKQN